MQKKKYFGQINFLHVATGGSILVLVMSILSYSGALNPLQITNNNPSSLSAIDHSQHALGQPASDYPVPDSGRMFSNDTARIEKFVADPYVLDMVQTPKQVEAGKPVLFIFNLFEKASNTWLWHDDMRFQITDPRGQTQVVLPNLHGHGSLIQIEYTFPTQGRYSVDLIIGQQTGSPNFMIEPKVIREVKYNVDVNQATSPSTNQGSSSPPGNIRDISMKVESWRFTPNVIEVNRGDLVRLHFVTAQDEVELYNGHGFGIEKYGVNVFLLKGTNQTVEFIADKPGKYTFRCTSFCSAPEAAIENHFNMVGTFIVNDINQSGRAGVNNSTGSIGTSAGQTGLPATMQGSTTIIGNTTIPNTNGTATTALSNASGTNATGIHRNALAENVTSANAFTKENVTAPVPPTGISTQADRGIPPMINASNNNNNNTAPATANNNASAAATSSSSPPASTAPLTTPNGGG
ncbi:MAG: cupredoxin domain-containing protein [Thermoproteota archaeon]|nr:cupredoxin domain-containing protein [Thermoproteota archaeon]